MDHKVPLTYAKDRSVDRPIRCTVPMNICFSREPSLLRNTIDLVLDSGPGARESWCRRVYPPIVYT